MISQSPEKPLGTVYLLHFDSKYKHAQHYIGWTQNLEQRLIEHASGRGARLIAVIVAAGISFSLVRTWEQVTKGQERKFKKWKKASDLCPVCRSQS